MTKPLVLTGLEVQIIENQLKEAYAFYRLMGVKTSQRLAIEGIIELLTSPRTEALGLSKEEWVHLGYGNVHPKKFYEAFKSIASSLSDKGEA